MTDKRCKIHQEAEPKLVLVDNGHYGKWVCSECNKYIVWAKKPDTVEKMKEIQATVRDIVRNSRKELSDEQMHFLFTIYTKKMLFDSETARIGQIKKWSIKND